MFSLCSVLIGDQCDCNAGSDVTIATDRFSVRCVFRAGAEFSQGFGLAAVQQSNLEGTTLEGGLTVIGVFVLLAALKC